MKTTVKTTVNNRWVYLTCTNREMLQVPNTDHEIIAPTHMNRLRLGHLRRLAREPAGPLGVSCVRACLLILRFLGGFPSFLCVRACVRACSILGGCVQQNVHAWGRRACVVYVTIHPRGCMCMRGRRVEFGLQCRAGLDWLTDDDHRLTDDDHRLTTGSSRFILAAADYTRLVTSVTRQARLVLCSFGGVVAAASFAARCVATGKGCN